MESLNFGKWKRIKIPKVDYHLINSKPYSTSILYSRVRMRKKIP